MRIILLTLSLISCSKSYIINWKCTTSAYFDGSFNFPTSWSAFTPAHSGQYGIPLFRSYDQIASFRVSLAKGVLVQLGQSVYPDDAFVLTNRSASFDVGVLQKLRDHYGRDCHLCDNIVNFFNCYERPQLQEIVCYDMLVLQLEIRAKTAYTAQVDLSSISHKIYLTFCGDTSTPECLAYKKYSDFKSIHYAKSKVSREFQMPYSNKEEMIGFWFKWIVRNYESKIGPRLIIGLNGHVHPFADFDLSAISFDESGSDSAGWESAVSLAPLSLTESFHPKFWALQSERDKIHYEMECPYPNFRNPRFFGVGWNITEVIGFFVLAAFILFFLTIGLTLYTYKIT